MAAVRSTSGKGLQFSSNPVLAPQLPAWRSRLVLFSMFAMFALLAGRAAWLQAVSNDFLQEQGAYRYARTLELPATRGRILDRNGDVLASSLPVKAVWAIPEEAARAPANKLRELARLLDVSDADLAGKLATGRGFVYLKRQVGMEKVGQVVKLGIPGVHTRKEYKRYYPHGELATHIVGFTSVDDAGQDGMELAHQDSLSRPPSATATACPRR
ncbi:hypothetical protein [Massilia agrisoli]|uniref:hypothetical protein n=1 Tax=Massilia agrisoli TaxID=2892444 RepID=UPI003FCEC9BB